MRRFAGTVVVDKNSLGGEQNLPEYNIAVYRKKGKRSWVNECLQKFFLQSKFTNSVHK